MKRAIVLALSVVLALTVAMPVAFGQVEQRSKPSGQTGQLGAAWWQWALEEPTGQNPLEGSYDESTPQGVIQCDGSNSSGVWFLAGSLSGDRVDRTCTAPADTQLFYPVVNAIFILNLPTDTQKAARQYLNEFLGAVLDDPVFEETLVVTVDGQEVSNKSSVRADSPLFKVTVPEDNVFDCPQCDPPFDLAEGTYDAMATGLWVTLPPLTEGKHTIHVEWRSPDVEFSQNNTYHLTVE